MFTGIIRSRGTVITRTNQDDATLLTIDVPDLQQPTVGDSVAVNGACVTMLKIAGTALDFRLMHETLAKTNLGSLHENDHVNIEQPLALGDTLDGHFVMGHVDGTATIVDATQRGDDMLFTFQPAATLMPYLIPKGSVALDGVSLTVVDVTTDAFTVSIMPFTLEHTTFGSRTVGDNVNIEVDMIGKYVVQLAERHGT